MILRYYTTLILLLLTCVGNASQDPQFEQLHPKIEFKIVNRFANSCAFILRSPQFIHKLNTVWDRVRSQSFRFSVADRILIENSSRLTDDNLKGLSDEGMATLIDIIFDVVNIRSYLAEPGIALSTDAGTFIKHFRDNNSLDFENAIANKHWKEAIRIYDSQMSVVLRGSLTIKKLLVSALIEAGGNVNLDRAQTILDELSRNYIGDEEVFQLLGTISARKYFEHKTLKNNMPALLDKAIDHYRKALNITSVSFKISSEAFQLHLERLNITHSSLPKAAESRSVIESLIPHLKYILTFASGKVRDMWTESSLLQVQLAELAIENPRLQPIQETVDRIISQPNSSEFFNDLANNIEALRPLFENKKRKKAQYEAILLRIRIHQRELDSKGGYG